MQAAFLWWICASKVDQALHVWAKDLLGKQTSVEELRVSLAGHVAALVLVQCKLRMSVRHVWAKVLLGKQASVGEPQASLAGHIAVFALVQCKLPFPVAPLQL